MKNTSAVLIALLVAAIVVHVGVVTQDFETLAKNGYLYDDSFYAFQIARNIAGGQGATFDGVNATNGFQPLYVAVLVPVYFVFGSNPLVPIYIALVLLALCTVVTAWYLYRIVRRYTSEAAALVATGLWVFCPVVMRQSANGLETALALMLCAASIHHYLGAIRSSGSVHRSAFIKLGVLLGLAMLARIDLSFLALAMLLDYLLVARRSKDTTAVANTLAGVATAALICAPWAIYGIAAVGSPLQESGAATRFLSLAYAPFFDLGSQSTMTDGPDAAFIWGHVVHTMSVLKVNPLTHAVFRSLERLGMATSTAGFVSVVANFIGVLLLVVFFFWWLRRVRSTRRGELNFLLLFAVMIVAAYSLWVFGVFFFTRYYYPVYFVAAIFGGLFLDDLARWVSNLRPFQRRAFAGASVLYAAVFAFMAWTSAFRSTPVYGFYDVATWVEENTAEDEVLGVFQGGAIGYLSGRKVINLDGKVNHEARIALREGRIEEYVTSAGIDIVMDDHKVLELFFGPWDSDDYARIADRALCTGADTGVPGWLGYRVATAAGQRAANPRAASPGSGLSR